VDPFVVSIVGLIILGSKIPSFIRWLTHQLARPTRTQRQGPTHSFPIPRPQVIRPPTTTKSDAEIEADREAYLAQERFFSQIRWESYISQSELERLKRLPIQDMTHQGVLRKLTKQNEACFYCSSRISIFDHHKDHLIPLAMWGPNHFDNIVLACAACNLSKGAKDPFHFIRSTTRPLRDLNALQSDIRSQVETALGHVPDWVRKLFKN